MNNDVNVAPIDVTEVISFNELKIKQNSIFPDVDSIKLVDIPSLNKFRDKENLKHKIENSLKNQNVTINRVLYNYNQKLYCTILINEKPLHTVIPEFAIGLRSNPDYTSFNGELPKPGNNPIRSLPPEKSPMLANISYPSPYTVYLNESDAQRKTCKALYSDTHRYRTALDVSFNEFVQSASFGEGVFELVADAGVGKTWWLSNKLTNIASNRQDIHVIYFDLRSRGIDNITEHIDFHFTRQANQFLSIYDLKTICVENDLSAVYDPNDTMHKDSFDYYTAKINENQQFERELRIEYYERSQSLKLLIAIDNIEKLSDAELEILYEKLSDRFALKRNVGLVVPMRPSTLSIRDRISHGGMNVHTRESLQSPSLEDVCLKRVRFNYLGENLGNSAILKDNSGFGKIINAIFHEKDTRSNFSTGEFLTQLCTYKNADSNYIDIRHFIRLLRSLFNSKIMDSLEKYSDVFYCTQALMSNNNDETSEHKSYLFNLIDDPHSQNNDIFPLARIRLLEFIHQNEPDEETIKKFHRKMKYSEASYTKIISEFERAGLIIKGKSKDESFHYKTDIPGILHLELLKNPWYIIMCKTSMHIYADSFVSGTDARSRALEEGLGEMYIEHYEKSGWVPDRHLIKFLANEEFLERKRISLCKHGVEKEWIIEVYEKLISPSKVVCDRLNFDIRRINPKKINEK